MVPSYTPRRIACLQPSATVILAEIGELDRVVACTKYCADVVPEVAAASAHDPGRFLDRQCRTDYCARALTWLSPLCLTRRKSVVEILKAGVRFLGLAPKSLADIYTDIAMIAGIVGASERGDEVIAHMQQRIEAGARHARPA